MPNRQGSITEESPLNRLPKPELGHSIDTDRPSGRFAGLRDLPNPANPQLPQRGGQPYHLLIADDEETFLELMYTQWKAHYPNQLQLYLLNPTDPRLDVVAWVRERLDRNLPLDAIYFDRNLPAGRNGVEILGQIANEVPAARYVPRVIMTADPDQEADEDTAALAAGAQRFMWKNSSHFLYEAALIVPQLRDNAQDQMWVDLNQQVTRLVAERADLDELLRKVSAFLKRHFAITAWYIRQKDQEGRLRRLTAEDPYDGGKYLNVDDVPILADLLRDGQPRRILSLTEAEIGPRFIGHLQGHRMIAVPVMFNGSIAGTVIQYRSPTEAPFRQKDEVFLTHLGMHVTAYQSEQQAQREQRQRQSDLLDFLVSVAALESADDIMKELAKRLHQDVQRGEIRRAKTSARILIATSGKIPRVAWFGMAEPRPYDDLDIGNTESACARCIQESKTILYHDIRRDCEGVYMATWDRACSELCVPVTVSDMSLGCVNLEHADQDYYNEDDQHYAEALARFAGEAMMRLRVRTLLLKSLGLVASLMRSKRDLMHQAILLLREFLGFAILIYLEPGPFEMASWRVRYVYGDDGRPTAAATVAQWQQLLDTCWSDTYLRSTLNRHRDQQIFFTDNRKEIVLASDLKSDTLSQAVLHLYPAGAHPGPVGILSLYFRIPNPLSRFERDVLVYFGQFIGDLLRGGQILQKYNERLVSAERVAQLAAAYRQFRHTLISRLGTIGNALNTLDQKLPGAPCITRIRDTVETLDQQVKAVRHLVKIPEMADLDLSQVWNDQVGELAEAAGQAGIGLVACYNSVPWRTDGEIVAVILFNLLLNAVYYAGSGATVTLEVDQDPERIRLRVRDTGRGISPELRPSLFEDRMTTSSEGGGFGLHFGRIRARDLGGDLEYDPTWTDGAGFVLILPRLAIE